MAESEDEQMTVGAVVLAFNILESLTEHQPARAVTLAKNLDIPRSTIYKHLQTLQSLGYVDKFGVQYVISSRFNRFTRTNHQAMDIDQSNKRVVDSLVEMTGETTGIYLLEGTEGSVWYQSSGSNTIDISMDGFEQHVHAHAPGKAALSTIDRDVVEGVIQQIERPALTENTHTRPAALQDAIDGIRNRGIAFGRGEFDEDLRSIAVPIPAENDLHGSLYVVGVQEHLSGKWFEEHLPGLLLSNVSEVSVTPQN